LKFVAAIFRGKLSSGSITVGQAALSSLPQHSQTSRYQEAVSGHPAIYVLWSIEICS